jgi:hypothetical protein
MRVDQLGLKKLEKKRRTDVCVSEGNKFDAIKQMNKK